MLPKLDRMSGGRLLGSCVGAVCCVGLALRVQAVPLAPLPPFVHLSQAPLYVAVGDLVPDGRADVAIVNVAAPLLQVLPSHGGRFADGHSIEVQNYPSGVYATDLNSDGAQDLLVANPSAHGFLNSGSGTFVGVNNTGDGCTISTPGDFNGDGRLDLAMLSATGALSIAFGAGDG